MDSISVSELKRLIPKVKIIDVRDRYQYIIGNIPTSKNIPANFLLMNPELYLNYEDTYFICCEYGNTSSRVCDSLKKKGYKVINILGGYREYSNI